MYYFAYGSNMDPKRICKRLDKSIEELGREHAILRGYRLEFNKIACRNPNEGYANIVPDKDGIVEGILYKVDEKDITKLDCYEGYPKHYYRENVKVILDDGKDVEAITYIANPNMVRDGLKPSKEYLEHLLKGCDVLSKEYCDKLKSIETVN